MKKEYLAPDLKYVPIVFQDSLSASTYTPDPQVPTRAGDDYEMDF